MLLEFIEKYFMTIIVNLVNLVNNFDEDGTNEIGY